MVRRTGTVGAAAAAAALALLTPLPRNADAFAFNTRLLTQHQTQRSSGGAYGLGNTMVSPPVLHRRASSVAREGVAMVSAASPERKRAAGFPEPGPGWLVEERDACGVGFIANAKADHKVVQHGLEALGCMEHRGACLADNV